HFAVPISSALRSTNIPWTTVPNGTVTTQLDKTESANVIVIFSRNVFYKYYLNGKVDEVPIDIDLSNAACGHAGHLIYCAGGDYGGNKAVYAYDYGNGKLFITGYL